MKVTQQQVVEKFMGRLPQLIWDNVFLPEGAECLTDDSRPRAFRYSRTPSGKRSKREVIDLGEVEVEGYSHRLVTVAGRGYFFWVRADVAPKNPAQSPSLQVAPWSEELDFGKKVVRKPVKNNHI